MLLYEHYCVKKYINFSLSTSRTTGSTTYTCMLTKKGGIAADLTVSVLQSDDGSSPLFPTVEEGIYLKHCTGCIKKNVSQ